MSCSSTFAVGMVVLVVNRDAIEGSARVTKQLKNGNVRIESLRDSQKSYWHTLQFRSGSGQRAGGDPWSVMQIVDPASGHGRQLLAKRHRRIVRGKLEALAVRFDMGNLSPEAVTAIEEVVARFE